MIQQISVFLDRGLEKPLKVGDLSCAPSSATGNDNFFFQYCEKYLSNANAIPISPDLPLVAREIKARNQTPLFGAFEDCVPDKWGRANIQRSFNEEKARSNSELRKLSEFEFLTRVPDLSRQGALRFSFDGGQTFEGPVSPIPRLDSLEKLAKIARRSVISDLSSRDIRTLGKIAASSGGSYPKTDLINKRGKLSIAKYKGADEFLSSPEWEAVALRLAKKAGIEVPKFDLYEVSAGKFALVLERFDRDSAGKRIPYISAHSLLEMPQIPSVFDEMSCSYEDLASTVRVEFGTDEAVKLFERVLFNLLVTNTDDHLKNHGFLFEGGKWKLSPVFDVNPTIYAEQISGIPLRFSKRGVGRSITDLIESSSAYGISEAQAKQIARCQDKAIRKWREVAAEYGFSKKKIATREKAFENENRAILQSW